MFKKIYLGNARIVINKQEKISIAINSRSRSKTPDIRSELNQKVYHKKMMKQGKTMQVVLQVYNSNTSNESNFEMLVKYPEDTNLQSFFEEA